MTGLLVGIALLGNAKLAADIGIVQGAALALFFGFSGNARSVLLKRGESTGIRAMLITRLVLMIPLSVGVFYLGSVFGGAAWEITSILILRKCVEWISELHLSLVEREEEFRIAGGHFFLQTILLVFVGGCMLLNHSWFLPSLVVWALCPLLISVPFVGRTLKNRNAANSMSWKLLLPHFGSTAVTGIGVYVFRISVLLVVGKEDAGNLFAAFAIGGVLGSLFASGFGPSLVLEEQRTGNLRMSRPLQLTALIFGGIGVGIIAVFHLIAFPGELFAGKSITFWQAVGFSLVGSVVMVFAHRQRLRDLQHGTKEDVFAPDVLVNIIIVIFIPAVFYSFGIHGMTWLYLFNAIVAFVFYWMTDSERASTLMGVKSRNLLRTVIAVLLTLPVFASLEGGLFRSEDLIFNSEGIMSRLPIPLSVGACYLGIALLGDYRRGNRGLSIVFFTFVLMVMSTFATTYATESAERGKLFLLLQYLLPMFALVLGMMYENHGKRDKIFEKAFLCTVMAIVPLKLVATWVQGHLALSPYLYLFSIYQHLQYVPVIMVTGFVLALFSLWNAGRWRILIIGMSPLMAIYVSASMSLAALGFSFLGGVAFYWSKSIRPKDSGGKSLGLLPLVLFLSVFVMYNHYVNVVTNQGSRGMYSSISGGMYESKISDSGLSNVSERRVIWKRYAEGFSKDPALLLFGHANPMDREVMPSAHNYYLDFVYNFGLLAMIPILSLIVYTFWFSGRNWKEVITSQSTVGFVFVVGVLLLCENNVKVSLRMPYSGIVIFFIWGILLSRLDALRTRGRYLVSDD
ncbi:MAG: hypothetical protein P1U58_03505 [Verrucomicrobiales bacterium]|nr:hypothetical protein [Verrucomicrobiales bacterium]